MRHLLLRLLPVALALIPLNAAMLIVAPLWGGVARSLGYSELQAGLITAATPLLWMLASPIVGRLSDRLGRRAPLVVGVGLACLAQGGFSGLLHAGLEGWLLPGPVAVGLAAARALLGIAGALVTVNSFALAADLSTPTQRTSIIAALGGLVGLGSLAGPALAAGTSALGSEAVLLAMAALPWVALPALPWLPAGRPGGTARSGPALSLLDPRIRDLLVVVLAGNAALAAADLLIGFVFADRVGGGLEVSGPLAGLGLVLAGAAVIGVHGIVAIRPIGPRALVASGPVVTALAFGIVAFVPSTGAILGACALAGVGVGLAMTGWNSGISLAVEDEEQGRAAGHVQLFTSLAYVSAPIAAGAAYGVWPALPFVLLIPVLLAAGALGAVSPSVRRAQQRGSAQADAIPLEPSP